MTQHRIASPGKALTAQQRAQRWAAVNDGLARGLSIKDIAAIVGTRPETLRQWIHKSADKEARAERGKNRACMTCGDEFLSNGPGNRMCGTCRARAHEDHPMVPNPGGHAGRRVQRARGA